ncbi:MAG: hypothetical protein AAGC47_01320 [Bacteroidota bacterium]
MKVRFSVAVLVWFILSIQCKSQTIAVDETVLAELNYFDDFLDKFSPEVPAHLFVLRIDTTTGARKSDELHFLLSSIYDSSLLDYINPKYAFSYNTRTYLIRTDLELEIDHARLFEGSDEILKTVEGFFIDYPELESRQMSMPIFRYCFFFKSLYGKVQGGQSIGSCDSYFEAPSDHDHFFYNNEDVERVENKQKKANSTEFAFLFRFRIS